MKNLNNTKASAGLTMIEVLVAVVILSIGLLGVAGLQVTGMRNNNSANLRTQASILASEFGDILRSNKTAVDAGDFDGPFDTSNLSISVEPNCRTINGTCSTTEMADTSIVDWGTDVAARLPDGVGTTARTGDIFTVTITWLDDRNNNATVAFITEFQP
ncbi:type IV pilus modification protein PilV [sulfur-oxidizing endosymbiont of Gigantopelta aegis]|uniref:type IV pilus modification protein PilV n=1 Tax=sulfur-oxidizing endosymbiont of Gigantopelta aegis TaxID=2794934 RepID=UPI0018DE0E7C|nr:type IV pilus modification protein PilV [sulfur-oxidizing endosymbiont of Gigantopelta aegis]